MTRFTEEDVRRLLPVRDAVGRLKEKFADWALGRGKNQVRRRLMLDTGAVLHSLAGSWGTYFGTKVYSTHPTHGAWFTFLLYDARTARPLAEFEANWLGQIRTGAASGLAADLLVTSDRVHVGCIGSGFQAQSQLEAIAAVRDLRSVRVWSRIREKREGFAQQMSRLLNVEVTAVAKPESVAEGSDILVTATGAKDPVISAEAVRPGMVVLAMGSNNPGRRELPEEVVRRSFIVVDDLDACRTEAGDLILAFGNDDWPEVLELKNLVLKKAAAWDPQTQPAVFKSVGLGIEDVAAAALVYERATGRKDGSYS